MLFITLSFQWDKQPRLIWKLLSFPSEPLKVMLQSEPPDFLYSARVESFPAEWKHSRSATLRNWRVSCRSEWLTDCAQLLHYVLMLCLCAPVFALADKQTRGIHYSSPPCLRVDPILPRASPQMSGYIASPCSSRLPPRCSVSRPTCNCQQAASSACGLGRQAHQHLPGVLRGHPQASRAGSGRANRGVEWRWTMSWGERLTQKQKLCPG